MCTVCVQIRCETGKQEYGSVSLPMSEHRFLSQNSSIRSFSYRAILCKKGVSESVQAFRKS